MSGPEKPPQERSQRFIIYVDLSELDFSRSATPGATEQRQFVKRAR